MTRRVNSQPTGEWFPRGEIRSEKPSRVSSRKYCLDIDAIYYLTREVMDRLAKKTERLGVGRGWEGEGVHSTGLMLAED